MSLGTSVRSMIMIRDADVKTEPVREWLASNIARNAFDPDVLDYPATSVLAAHNGEVITYTPTQPVLAIESVGVSKTASTQDVATAMVETVRAAAAFAYRAGVRELMFIGSDELTAKGAEKLGFERINFPVFRLKLGSK